MSETRHWVKPLAAKTRTAASRIWRRRSSRETDIRRRSPLSLDRLVSQDTGDARRAPLSQPAGASGRAPGPAAAAADPRPAAACAPDAPLARRPPAQALALRGRLRPRADGLLRGGLDRRASADLLGDLEPPGAGAARTHEPAARAGADRRRPGQGARPRRARRPRVRPG